MRENRRGLYLRLALVAMTILLLGSFWLSRGEASKPLSMVVMPMVPREGEPVLAIFKLNNPSSQALPTNYQFYVNGELITEGVTTIPPRSGESHQYAYKNPLKLGEQVNFVVRTQSELGNHQEAVSSPLYPPQALTSFVSFAAMSTSVMSSVITTTYYRGTFGTDTGINMGLIASVVLIILLSFLELTGHRVQRNSLSIFGRLRIRLSLLSWILFIIFIGIIYTNIALILAT